MLCFLKKDNTLKKIFTYTLLIFGFGLFFQTCEKDDICAEGTATTPKLVIRFYDAINVEETKTVSNFIVYGADNNNEVVFFTNISISDTDSVAVPLRNDSNITRLGFHKDIVGEDFETGNMDIIDTDYDIENVYVSRACGFKNIYSNFNATLVNDPDIWISNIEISNSTIENEILAHVKIYH